MRFLSKKFILCFLIIVCSATIAFLHNSSNTYNQYISVATNSTIDDNTIFNLHYQNKVWTFKASDFELSGDLFSVDERINRYNRNGSKSDKIKLIKKLLKINIKPEVAFNYIYFGFNNKLNKIQKNIEKTPQNAEISIKNNNINIKNEIIGIKLNKYLFYNNLIKLYENCDIVDLEIPVIKSTPNITAEMLKQYTHKRAEFTTSIATSTSGRKYNIRKALNKINGTHLSKHEKFSFNNCVGNRSVNNGYKNAKVIVNGEFVEGIGGGVCQVSSTLYNAVLLSGLNVLSSQKHSQRVGYVKAGFDAMVNYGTSDLVFENNTEGDVYILCNYSNNQITISIYGAKLGNVSFERDYEIVNPVSAGEQEIIYDTQGKYADKVMYSDESFELKRARDGYTIKSYLIKYINGVEVDKKLLRADKYLPQHSIIVYGTKQRELNFVIDKDEIFN